MGMQNDNVRTYWLVIAVLAGICFFAISQPLIGLMATVMTLVWVEPFVEQE